MHPFREGNGRSAKIFLQCLAANHQQVIDYPRENDQMIKAQIEADIDQIARLIKVEAAPNKKIAYQELKKQVRRNNC